MLAELLLQLLVEPLLLQLPALLQLFLLVALLLLRLLRRLNLHLSLHLLSNRLDQLAIDADDLVRRDALPILKQLLLQVLLHLLMHQLLDQCCLILLAHVTRQIHLLAIGRLLLHEVAVRSFLLVVAALQELHAAVGVLGLLKGAAAQALQVLRLLELAEGVVEIILSLVGRA